MISEELRQSLITAQALAKAEGRMDIFGVLNVLHASILMDKSDELHEAAKSWVISAVED